MKTPLIPRIRYVDRLSGDVVIEFDDRTCVLYSAALFYAAIGDAKVLTLAEEEPPEEG